MDSKLARSISNALGGQNPRNLEYPWYEVWGIALNSMVLYPPTNTVTIAPQWVITRTVISNDDIPRRSSQIPDFCILYRRTERNCPKITTTLEVPLDDLTTIINRIIILVEIKPLRPTWNARRVQVEKNRTLTQLMEQAKYVFSRSLQGQVDGIVAIGHYWTYYRFSRNSMSPLTENEDPSYVQEELGLISDYVVIGDGILGISKDNIIRGCVSNLRGIYNGFTD